MHVDPGQIDRLIDAVIERLGKESIDHGNRNLDQHSFQARSAPSPIPSHPGKNGVFEEVNDAISAAHNSQRELMLLSVEKRKEIITNIRKRCRENVRLLSEMAHRETGMGKIEDKIQKNLLVIDKTPGMEILTPEAFSGDHGLSIVEHAPWGVIGSITPSTNPSETIINNGIGFIAAGNTGVFNAHPSSKAVSAKTIEIINLASKEVKGPDNILTCTKNPTISSANELMKHPLVKLLVVTGGPGVVKAAMASGKKVIAAGPGNPTAVVDETADLEKAAKDIVFGASLDNNIICVDEKAIVAVDSIANRLKAQLCENGAFEITDGDIHRLTEAIFEGDHPNKSFVGKDATFIAKKLGISTPSNTKLLLMDVFLDHPIIQIEQLMPVIGLVRAKDVDEAIAMAVDIEHGNRHTATMHSRNIDSLHKMARAIDCSIFVKNGPSVAGLGFTGEGFTSFTIASPTGEGLTTAKDFSRKRRCTLKDYFRIV